MVAWQPLGHSDVTRACPGGGHCFRTVPVMECAGFLWECLSIVFRSHTDPIFHGCSRLPNSLDRQLLGIARLAKLMPLLLGPVCLSRETASKKM